MLTNTFLKKPVKVALVNPLNIITAKYFFVGNISDKISKAIEQKNDRVLKEFYGHNYQRKLYQITPIETQLSFIQDKIGGDDLDEEFEEYLAESSKVAKKQQETNYSNLVFYNYDNVDDLMKKIYVETGIAPFKQHLVWVYNGIIYKNYTILKGEFEIKWNLLEDNVDQLNTGMRQNREAKTYESLATELKYIPNMFTKICDYVTNSGFEVYVFNIDDYIEIFPHKTNEKLVNEYYDIFVKYYWPIFTKEIFVKYVKSKYSSEVQYSELVIEYPLIFDVNQKRLQRVYKHESDLLALLYNSVLDIFPINVKKLTIQFNDVIHVKLRDIFDNLSTDETYPKIIYTPAVNKTKEPIKIMKYYTLASNIDQRIPKSIDSNIVNISARYENNVNGEIRIDNKNIKLSMSWQDQSLVELSSLRKLLSKLLLKFNHNLKNILQNDFDMIRKIDEILSSETTYPNYVLSGIIDIDKFVTASSFKKMRDILSTFERANILTVVSNTNEKISMLFHKGMYNKITTMIETVMAASKTMSLNNYYTYLFDQSVKQKWDKIYGGRLVNIYRRTTSLRIEIVEAQIDEVKIINTFMSLFLKMVIDSGLLKLKEISEPDSDKTLAKLIDVDPVLYSFKTDLQGRYGRICQRKKQPTIYTEHEVKNMSKEEKDKLTEYYNFTLNRPAYYACTNPKYPYFSFTQNHHPNGFCLPCCAAKPLSALNPKRQSIIKHCLSTHRYIESLKDEETNYILNYSKFPLVNRFTKLPKSSLSDLLNGELINEQFVIYGVEQTIPMISIFAFVNDISISDSVEKLLSMLDNNNFYSLLDGTLPMYFSDSDDLKVSLLQFISHDNKFYTDFERWDDLIIELIHYLNYNVIIFDETNDDEFEILVNIENFGLHGIENAKYILCVKSKSVLNPIVKIENSEITQLIFAIEDETIATLNDIIDSNMRNKTKIKTITLTDIVDTKLKIDKYYVNKTNKCYAVSINNTYFPIEYTNYVAKHVTLTMTIKNTYEETLKLIEKINELLPEKKIILEFIVKCKDKYYAFQDQNGFFYYFKYVENVKLDLPVMETNYSMIDVNNLIVKDTKPTIDNRTKLFDISMYRNNVFQIFMDTLKRSAKIYRKTAKYTKYMNLLMKQETAEFSDELTNFIKQEFPDEDDYNFFVKDTEMLLNIIQDIKKNIPVDKEIIKILEKGKHVDNIMLKLSENVEKDTMETLLEIANEIAVEKQLPKNFKFPNQYTTCQDSEHQYCDGKKLIIDGFTIEEFVKLYYDIYVNSFTKRLVLNTEEERIIDEFKFNTKPNELLKIYY